MQYRLMDYVCLISVAAANFYYKVRCSFNIIHK